MRGGNIRVKTHVNAKADSSAMSSRASVLQRKCACGGASGLTGSCSSCENTRLLGIPRQMNLRTNESGDEHEQEAHRVAEHVTGKQDETVKSTASRSRETTPVQRRLSGNSTAGIASAPSIVQDVLSSHGQPLDAGSRAFFAPRFGRDFSQVRVHADARAAESAEAVNALAYTVGNHVVFASGQYLPGGSTQSNLLAHELAHVTQHRESGGLGARPLNRSKASTASDEPSLESRVQVIVNELHNQKRKSHWRAAHSIYLDLEELGEAAFDLLSTSRPAGEVAAVHDIGAAAAKSVGDMQRYWERRRRQMNVLASDVGHIDDATLNAVVTELSDLESRFGAVRIAPRSEPKSAKKLARLRGPELVQLQGPVDLDPVYPRSVEFAAEQLGSTGYFTGLLPAGEYRLGAQTFTVGAGTKTTDPKVLTILW
jgi:Domain of unknown function (DUF4157)